MDLSQKRAMDYLQSVEKVHKTTAFPSPDPCCTLPNNKTSTDCADYTTHPCRCSSASQGEICHQSNSNNHNNRVISIEPQCNGCNKLDHLQDIKRFTGKCDSSGADKWKSSMWNDKTVNFSDKCETPKTHGCTGYSGPIRYYAQPDLHPYNETGYCNKMYNMTQQLHPNRQPHNVNMQFIGPYPRSPNPYQQINDAKTDYYCHDMIQKDVFKQHLSSPYRPANKSPPNTDECISYHNAKSNCQSNKFQLPTYLLNFFKTVADISRFYNAFIQNIYVPTDSICIPFGDGIVIKISREGLQSMSAERYLVANICQLYTQVHAFLPYLFHSSHFQKLASSFCDWYAEQASKLGSSDESEEHMKIHRLSFMRLVLLELDTYRLNAQNPPKITPSSGSLNVALDDPWYPVLYKQHKKHPQIQNQRVPDEPGRQINIHTVVNIQRDDAKPIPPPPPYPHHLRKSDLAAKSYIYNNNSPYGIQNPSLNYQCGNQGAASPVKNPIGDYKTNYYKQTLCDKQNPNLRWRRSKSDLTPRRIQTDLQHQQQQKRNRNESQPSKVQSQRNSYDISLIKKEEPSGKRQKATNEKGEVISMPSLSNFIDFQLLEGELNSNGNANLTDSYKVALTDIEPPISPLPLTIDESADIESTIDEEKRKNDEMNKDHLDEEGEKEAKALESSLGLLPETARMMVRKRRIKKGQRRLIQQKIITDKKLDSVDKHSEQACATEDLAVMEAKVCN